MLELLGFEEEHLKINQNFAPLFRSNFIIIYSNIFVFIEFFWFKKEKLFCEVYLYVTGREIQMSKILRIYFWFVCPSMEMWIQKNKTTTATNRPNKSTHTHKVGNWFFYLDYQSTSGSEFGHKAERFDQIGHRRFIRFWLWVIWQKKKNSCVTR